MAFRAPRSAGPPPDRRGGITRRAIGAVVACLIMPFVSPPLIAPLVADTAAAATPRPFAASKSFNRPIKANPRVDPHSAAMVARASRRGMLHGNLYQYAIPIYTATATTPRYHVVCDHEGAWGRCPLSKTPMPIPRRAKPNLGEDGVLTVIDPTTNTVGEYWQAYKVKGQWRASWGAVNSLSGSGWGGASTGSGASRLAGVIRVSEIRAGVINHALVLQGDNVCARVVRFPALKTDGGSTRSDCIPEGARLQLDPSIDLSAVKGLTPGERIVARAMQVYGGYLIDRGGTSLAASFERASDASSLSPGSTYTKAGLTHDYYGLPHVPWRRLRVLGSWTG